VRSRSLPRSLDPLPGEALDGFLLRLAYRLELTPRRLAELTGLMSQHKSYMPISILVHLSDPERDAFARAVRLIPSEVAELCLSSMGDRYAPVSTAPEARQWRGMGRKNLWIFDRATRYCPQCLVGDGSSIQDDLGGAWQKAWRLPVVFSCARHGRLLEHLCPGCARPARDTSSHPAKYVIPQLCRGGLHPTECRSLLPGFKPSAASATCGVSLGAAAHAPGPRRPPKAIVSLQQRINQLLDPGGPTATASVGVLASARQYFTDLRLITHLIRLSWPRVQEIMAIPAPFGSAISEDRDRAQEQQKNRRISRRSMYDAPPLDAYTCSSLLAIADWLLSCSRPELLTDQLHHLLAYDQRAPGRAAWTKDILASRPDCSPGLRQAMSPVLQSYSPLPAGRRRRALRRPVRMTRYRPEHVAQNLQDDWYERYFAQMSGIAAVHLRRAAAIHLCQLAVGGSARNAARFLDITDGRAHASTMRVQQWACQSPEPRQFEAALHRLADELDSAPRLINYQRRREALRDWCIDPETWQLLISELDTLHKYASRLQLGDRKRQTASILVWARVTQGAHILAPHPILDSLPADLRSAWRHTDTATWARLKEGKAGHHERSLKRILDSYADTLAVRIDHDQFPSQGLGRG
jgi:TniQ